MNSVDIIKLTFLKKVHGIVVTILILIVLIVFLMTFKYENKLITNAIVVKESTFKLKTYLKESDLKYLNNEMKLNNNKQTYKVISISEGYTLYNNDNYKELIIETKIPKKKRINNNIIKLTLTKEKTNLITHLYKRIIGG